MFSSVASVIAHVNAGKVRAIGTTGLKRTPVAPDVPTLDESALPGYVVTGYHLLFVPAATPSEIVARLNAEVVKALELPATKERFASLGRRLRPVRQGRDRSMGSRRQGRWRAT